MIDKTLGILLSDMMKVIMHLWVSQARHHFHPLMHVSDT